MLAAKPCSLPSLLTSRARTPVSMRRGPCVGSLGSRDVRKSASNSSNEGRKTDAKDWGFKAAQPQKHDERDQDEEDLSQLEALEEWLFSPLVESFFKAAFLSATALTVANFAGIDLTQRLIFDPEIPSLSLMLSAPALIILLIVTLGKFQNTPSDLELQYLAECNKRAGLVVVALGGGSEGGAAGVTLPQLQQGMSWDTWASALGLLQLYMLQPWAEPAKGSDVVSEVAGRIMTLLGKELLVRGAVFGLLLNFVNDVVGGAAPDSPLFQLKLLQLLGVSGSETCRWLAGLLLLFLLLPGSFIEAQAGRDFARAAIVGPIRDQALTAVASGNITRAARQAAGGSSVGSSTSSGAESSSTGAGTASTGGAADARASLAGLLLATPRQLAASLTIAVARIRRASVAASAVAVGGASGQAPSSGIANSTGTQAAYYNKSPAAASSSGTSSSTNSTPSSSSSSSTPAAPLAANSSSTTEASTTTTTTGSSCNSATASSSTGSHDAADEWRALATAFALEAGTSGDSGDEEVEDSIEEQLLQEEYLPLLQVTTPQDQIIYWWLATYSMLSTLGINAAFMATGGSLLASLCTALLVRVCPMLLLDWRLQSWSRQRAAAQ